MQKLHHHIKELSDTLTSKGYDGYFLTNADYPGKLAESLGSFMAEQQKENERTDLNLHLKTYTYWKDEDNYTTCSFTVSYHLENGFIVTAMQVERNLHGSKFVTIDINLEKNDQILVRNQVNTMAEIPKLKHDKIMLSSKIHTSHP